MCFGTYKAGKEKQTMSKGNQKEENLLTEDPLLCSMLMVMLEQFLLAELLFVIQSFGQQQIISLEVSLKAST